MAQNPTPITLFPASTEVLATDVYIGVDTTDPTQSPSGTTKKYTVEQLSSFLLGQLNVNNIRSCLVGTTVNLTATYVSGSDLEFPGIGATLTNAGSAAALVIDGVTLSVGDRILVKDQSSQLENGVYIVTVEGSPSVLWILERSEDYDGSDSNEIQEGDFCIVSEGTINQVSIWVQTGTGPFVVGTTPIIFTGQNISTTTGTLPVITGGTGVNSFTAYSLITGGVTSTSDLQNVSGVGTLNQVLVSQGPGALPIWSTVPVSGLVTSVTGTAFQISASPTIGNVILSLIGPYTPSTYTAHGVLLGEGTSSIVATSAGTSGQLLQSGGASADPNWTTATYPSTTTANQILFSSATNTISQITTSANGVLITSAGSVPSISSTLPSAVQDNITRLGTIASIGAPLGSAFGGTGINNGGSTITVGGNTAFSGAFTFTGTITGNTAVTFPTSGTLATTTGSIASVVTDSGTATASAGAINLLGTANQISSSGAGSTVTLALPQSIATTSSPTFAALTLTAPLPVTSGGTGLSSTTANQILYSSSTSVIGQISTAANGVLITSAGSVPSISSTLPSAVQGNITTVGIVTSGQWQATPVTVPYGGTGASSFTSHGVIIGQNVSTLTSTSAGTANQILQSQGASADPTWSTATYPATTTASQILYSSATNVVGQITTANSSALTTNASGVPSFVGPMTNGQLIIGSTGAQPVAAALTAGAGITITNTAGGITVSTSAFTGAWTDEGTNFAALADNGYFITSTVTATLPIVVSQGDLVQFVVDTASILTITANTGQKIRIGSVISATAGTAVNTSIGDSITLVYRSSDATWFSLGGAQGTWALT